MKAFIVDSTYIHEDNKTKVLLFGKLENGQSFASVSDFQPYFYIKSSDSKKISKYLGKFKTSKTDLTNFKKEPLTKISSTTQTDLNKLYEAIHKKIDTYEADIKPHFRFLMDKDILGTINLEGHYETSEKVDRVYQNPEISPENEFQPNLKTASIDIEINENKNQLLCIGIHSEKEKKNFFISNKKTKLKNAELCSSEEECLEKFKSYFLKLDPDIITGWNMIDFDLQYLKQKFEKHKISFDIGRDNSQPRIRIQKNFFRNSTANITGRQVLDALNLIRDPFIQEAPSIKNARFDSYSLEDVSQAILSKGKSIKGKGPERHAQIIEFYKKSPQKVVDYNLLDCELAYKILEKAKLLDLAIERSKLTGMPLDRLTGSIANFDSLYIRRANAKNLASPTLRFTEKQERLKGGYVQETNPGIYHNVLVLDFKSLYPSIMKTFNIDPFAYQTESSKKESIKAPNGAEFSKEQGILPEIIETLHKAREKAKKENRELSSYAIKIIMNSFWGVLASPNCRYFDFKMASAITAFARFIIKLTAKETEKKFKTQVIYSDTDSVFINTKLKSKSKAESLGKDIQNYINKFYDKYVEKNYSVKSYLELEFEKLYLALMIPKLRGKSEKGAKKRYAGLLEKNNKEEIQITGLEAIRGDWTEAAQEFQKSLLLKVFKKQPVQKFIKSYIQNLKQGTLDSKLVYRKSLRKPLSEYTKTTPPHVKAAKLLPKIDSNIIQYYITKNGPEPIQNLKHKIDYNHYIEKQIKPIAQQVLTLFKKDFDEILAGSKQAKLF
jgi:DNA polymerase-2